MNKLKIEYPIIVEGKYDKIKLDSVVDGRVFTTEGFRIFASDGRKSLLKRLTEFSKVIVLTDSDGGGTVIRSYLSSVLRQENVIHLYIPQVKGKEKRKKEYSKAGYLGVEGTDSAALRELLLPFAVNKSESNSKVKKGGITKNLLYMYGLSGREESGKLRSEFAVKLGLPAEISANAFLSAVNVLYNEDEFVLLLSEFSDKKHNEGNQT